MRNKWGTVFLLIFSVIQNTRFFNHKSEVISIIFNLMNNSLKYYDSEKEKPIVLVSVITNQEEARIFIKDNGI